MSLESIIALEKELGLPELDIFLKNTPDAPCVYGIDEIARAYCGLPYLPRLIPGYWCHGWQPDYYNFCVDLLRPGALPGGVHWFPREAQAAYFRSEGIASSRAIGHPLVYLPPLDLPRRPDSLLVMPSRSFRGHPLAQDCLYSDAVAALRDQFEEIVICISPQSFDQGDWLESFTKHGLPIVRGAWAQDRHGFQRIARLLSQFEYVTTNGMGSQIAYAAYFGAKISVQGPYPVVAPPDKPTSLFSRLPQMREEFHRVMSISTLLWHEPWLDVAPHEAATAVEWGRRELGAENRLSPAELAREFRLTPAQMAGFTRELEEILRDRGKYERQAEELELRLQELEQKLAESSEQASAQKTEFTKVKGALAKLREQTESLAWRRFGRPLYSLEKRLRSKKD